MISLIIGIAFALLNFVATLITLYVFYYEINRSKRIKRPKRNRRRPFQTIPLNNNINKELKTDIRSFILRIRKMRRRFLIGVPIFLLIIFSCDIFIASKFIRSHNLDQMMQILFLDKLHRDADDLLDNLLCEVRNFSMHHPEFNIEYKIDRERTPSLENVIIDNAFQIILFAERRNLSVNPEVKKIKWILDDVTDLKNEIEKIEESLENPYKVKKGDKHWNICKEYLTNVVDLEPGKITAILKRTALIDEIVPDFFIFNIYHKGVFLTTVTQGEAEISPTMIRLLFHKEEVDQLVDQNEELKRQVEKYKNQFLRTTIIDSSSLKIREIK